MFSDRARDFLDATAWRDAACEALTGDASARKYFRLRKDKQSAVLMDASRVLESVAPFIRVNQHLHRLGFSVPAILFRADEMGLLLLEDFGDALFTRLLDNQTGIGKTLHAGHRSLDCPAPNPRAIPKDLRAYHPEKMLEDIELFLEWNTPAIARAGKDEFRTVWREVLPLAHQVPASLLLRDYHVANLMLLPDRQGVRQTGLLIFRTRIKGRLPMIWFRCSKMPGARSRKNSGKKWWPVIWRIPRA